MTARSFASGTVSFGLVNIPVKLYSTGEAAAGIQLNMLHRKCGSRLKQQYVCPTDEEVVGREDIVKGYEYAKGQYVLLSDDEQKALAREATNAIAISEFIPLEKVDPVYFEKAYYVGPDKGGERPYQLLSEAMVRTGRAALASYAARGKDYLVLLRPYEGGLIMQQLRYHDELRPFSEVPIGNGEVRDSELELAVQLIEQIATEEFVPETYEDQVRQRTRELIEKKIQGEEITAPPAEAPRAQVIDLMAALKASLGTAPGQAERGGGAAKRKAAHAAAKPDAKPAKQAKQETTGPRRLTTPSATRPAMRAVRAASTTSPTSPPSNIAPSLASRKPAKASPRTPQAPAAAARGRGAAPGATAGPASPASNAADRVARPRRQK